MDITIVGIDIAKRIFCAPRSVSMMCQHFSGRNESTVFNNLDDPTKVYSVYRRGACAA